MELAQGDFQEIMKIDELHGIEAPDVYDEWFFRAKVAIIYSRVV